MTTRSAQLASLADDTFDVLVVGGGITGCGVAREAALRGLSAGLVEKDDFASGTSSRSSRLIHGGVRYLEHGHLHLVFEASAERRRLLRLAPHLVWPLEFLWPVYEGARVPRWKLRAGLALYDVLALFRNVGRHRGRSADDVLDREPGLRATGLRGGATYYDAGTDDARLTLANAVGALEAGAAVANHAEVLAVTPGSPLTVARVRDTLSGRELEVRARVVVNATGPWSEETRRRSSIGGQARAGTVRGSKGVHLLVPRGRIGSRGAVTLLSPVDGRVMFVLPAGRFATIGTTDTYTDAPADEVRASGADVDYLLATANYFFPDAVLTPGDVVSAWAGIRPLLPAKGSTPGSATREHAVTAEGAIVAVTGGKLTTYRVMAEDVVAAACRLLGRRARGHPSADAPLPGGEEPFVGVHAAARDAVNDDALAAHLSRAHGTRWRGVWDEISRDGGAERLAPDLPYTVGEMRWCAAHEMAPTLADLLMRRTKLAFETRDHGAAAAARVAAAVGPVLGWSAADAERAVARYADDARRIFGVDDAASVRTPRPTDRESSAAPRP